MKDLDEKNGKFFDEKEFKTTDSSKSGSDKAMMSAAWERSHAGNVAESVFLQSATEEEKKRWHALRCLDLPSLPEQEKRALLTIGRKVLEELDETMESAPDATAETAEKVLFLAEGYGDRWDALESIVVAASKKGLTEINTSTKKRTLKGMVGKLESEKSRIFRAKGEIPEPGHPVKRMFCLILALLLALGVAGMFLPPLAGLLTEELLENAIYVVGLVLMVASCFFLGIWGAVAVMVVFGAVVYGGMSIMPVALLGKLMVTLAVAVIEFFCLRTAKREGAKLTPAVKQKRAEAVAAVRREGDLGYRVADVLVKQVEKFLKEDRALQGGRTEEIEKHHQEIRPYVEQYRNRLQTIRIGMDEFRSVK